MKNLANFRKTVWIRDRFLPTGTGRRTFLPLSYMKGDWFLKFENGITVLPGSLRVSPR